VKDRTQTTVLEIDREANLLHLTQKPISLLSRILRNSTIRGEVVLDLFAGSGSTLIACEQLGRRCFAMELDARYCDVIVQRWETYTGQKARRIQAVPSGENPGPSITPLGAPDRIVQQPTGATPDRDTGASQNAKPAVDAHQEDQ
jgi:hypothetical protein